MKKLLLLLLACASTAAAEQIRETRDGATVEAAVSTRSPTRIRIDGAKIVDVVGNIESSVQCSPKAAEAPSAAVPAGSSSGRGDIALVCDLAKGQIFIRPASGAGKSINLFVSSEQATYSLLLHPADIAADTIVIRDKSIKPQAGAGGNRSQAAGRASAYVRSLKAMLLSMAGGHAPADIEAEEMDQVQNLWTEAEFRLVGQFRGRGLLGEKYLLKNISASPMVLAEQEFDREEDGVLAVAIENMNLRPGDSTPVYVIRAGE